MKKLKFEKKMLNKLLLLLFTTYVTTTFLNYPPMTKLQIHHIGSQSKINFFFLNGMGRMSGRTG